MDQRVDLTLRDFSGDSAPSVVSIVHDDYHAQFVGLAADGRQFFVTAPFVWPSPTQESARFVARYLFDDNGVMVESTIVPLDVRSGDDEPAGSSDALSAETEEQVTHRLLDEIGPVTFGDIAVAPFAIVAHGHEFGLILRGPEFAGVEGDDDDEWYWTVDVEPGNYMSFPAPWDGDYDT